MHGKQRFLSRFRDGFKKAETEHFSCFLRRRDAAFLRLGAESAVHSTSQRLVIGLGLPHPTETALLLHQLTGCPFIPGSTVKGLLRATARAVASGEPEGEQQLWQEAWQQVFGPAHDGQLAQAKGSCTFYDAFPTRWPSLELDVLTPHYPDYYRGTLPYPGDWENPIPTSFLTVAPGAQLRFWFRVAEEAESRDRLIDSIKRLLETGLAWLGVGGKRSAGYGFFGEPELPAGTTASDLPRTTGQRSAPSPPQLPEQELWQDAMLSWLPGEQQLQANHGQRKAFAKGLTLLETLPESAREKLTRKKNRKPLPATVTVKVHGQRCLEIIGVDIK